LSKFDIQNDSDALPWDENNRIYAVVLPVLFESKSDPVQGLIFLALLFEVASSSNTAYPFLKYISNNLQLF